MAGVVGVSIRDEVLVEHGVVEPVVARIENDGLFAAPCVHAHTRRDFLPPGDAGLFGLDAEMGVSIILFSPNSSSIPWLTL